jgi:hypothetical protein
VTAARSLWRPALVSLLASRALIAVVVVGTLALFVHGIAPVTGAAQSLVQWDARSYLAIAAKGYGPVVEPHDAFLPGFPLAIHAVALLVRDEVTAALIVCLIAEALALWYVARLLQHERDADAGRFAALLLAFAPTAIFLTAPFTEGPFIAAAAASLLYARQGRTTAACWAAAIAASVRLTGLALLPALAVECLMQSRWRLRSSHLALLIIPVPLLLYCAYMAVHTGDPLALFHAEASPSFGQSLAPPWKGFATSWQTMITTADGENRSIFAREVAFGLLGLLAVIAMWVSTRVPRSFALYCSIAWLMTASLSFWRSEPRYLLALFPALLVIVDLTQRHRGARPVIVAISGVLMCLGTIVFAEGRWLG